MTAQVNCIHWIKLKVTPVFSKFTEEILGHFEGPEIYSFAHI